MIWAVTWDLQQFGNLTSVDSDEHMLPPFKMMFSLKLKTHRIFKRQAKTLIRCAYAQADLSLCWSHKPHCWKSLVAAHLCNINEAADYIMALIALSSAQTRANLHKRTDSPEPLLLAYTKYGCSWRLGPKISPLSLLERLKEASAHAHMR